MSKSLLRQRRGKPGVINLTMHAALATVACAPYVDPRRVHRVDVVLPDKTQRK